jgi:predicted PurR-regulated permease PerM
VARRGDDWTPPPWFAISTGVAWRFLVIVAAVGVFVAAAIALGVIVLPMIFALFFASVLSPMYSKLRARRWRPALASFCCLLVVASTLGLFVFVAFKSLVGPWDDIGAKLSTGADTLEQRFDNLFKSGASTTPTIIRNDVGGVVHLLVNGALHLVSVVMSIASTLLLSLLVLFFYLKDGDKMWRAVASLGGDRAGLVDRIGRRMWSAVRSFIVGTASVAVVDALGIGLGALLLGVPSVLSIAMITFFLAFIPYFGAIFGGVIACLIAVADGGLDKGIAMALVVLVVQQVESNVLEPLLVGRQTRLHPLVVALGVIAGGAIAGVLGMFLAVPMIAAAVAGIDEVRRSSVTGRMAVSTPVTPDG